MKANILWLFFLFLTFVITLPISWYGMAKADFFYPILHDAIGIDKHIQRYAPQNQLNKLEFEKTTKIERIALFHGVVEAIHNNGEGLEKLKYTQKSTANEIQLFTEAEILHLKDVALLLNKIKPIVLIAMLVWLIWIAWIFLKRIKLPSAKQFFLLGVFLIVVMIAILSFGPERVFNQLHIWAFPEGQWLFYYEESLMSNLMMAPYIFIYISVIWLIISIVFTVLILRMLRLFQESRY